MKHKICSLIVLLLALCLCPFLYSQTHRLPTGLYLHPVGQSVVLQGTLPQSLLLSQDGRSVITVCSGALQGVESLNTQTHALQAWTAYQKLPDPHGSYVPTGGAFYGIALSPDQHTLYVAGGSTDVIHRFTRSSSGALTPLSDFADPGIGGGHAFPAGLALNGNGSQLYVANNLSNTLSVFDTHSGKLIGLAPTAGYPLAVAALDNGSKAFVASERDSCVSVIDPQTMKSIGLISTGSHPDALCLTHDNTHLFVANGDSDSVSLIDTRTDKVLRTILLRPATQRGLSGVTPTGIALSPNQTTLYISLADLNSVAVLSLNPARDDAKLEGYIPTGWYPTAVEVAPDDKTLFVADGKGIDASHPNLLGPGPTGQGEKARFIHNILRGAVSIIPVPNSKQLLADTHDVLKNARADAPLDSGDTQAAAVIKSLPMKHVFYIIKENRTYDQVLGDMPQGNGDPKLTLFGKQVTPNLHALASDFVLLDNFYVCGEVSPDGWNWSTSGYANEYVERTVPENYSEDGKARPRARTYDYEGLNNSFPVSLLGGQDVSQSPGGYIWDNVASHDLTLRNYGCFMALPGIAAKPLLAGNTCPAFAMFNLVVPDSSYWGKTRSLSRFDSWDTEFKKYEKTGKLPSFEIIRLMRDHTAGTVPGMDSPKAMVADNDYAVGELVQAVSHSKFWKSSAIVVVEDDAQNGPDHVDCHRSTAYIISPFIKRHSIDHHFYNTDSLLRTMELMMHLPPMTRYDAVAPPIQDFTKKPDFTPFTAYKPNIGIMNTRNTPNSYGAKESERMNFSAADEAPERELNEVLWHSIKGPNIPMPEPRGL